MARLRRKAGAIENLAAGVAFPPRRPVHRPKRYDLKSPRIGLTVRRLFSWGRKLSASKPISRLLMVVFALAFLFETWVWGGMVAIMRWAARSIPWAAFRARAQSIINRLPAFVSVLLFGVPVVVGELGSAASVVLIAMGHVLMGALIYLLLKLFMLTLVALVFDLTRDKLMTLPWFVVVYNYFHKWHEWALELVAPYRKAAARVLRDASAAALAQWRRLRSDLAARFGVERRERDLTLD